MRKLRCGGVILALLVALIADSSAQPGRNPPAETQDNDAQRQQHESASDERGSAQSPFVVQPLPTPKSAEETAREQREAGEKRNSDWWTWLLSLLTFLAIAGQLIVLAFQAFYLRGTLLVTKAAADAASLNARALMRAERGYLFIQITAERVSKITRESGRWDKSEAMFNEETDTPSLGY